MSSSTSPSKLRREGRNAFEPGVDPMDVQPYKKGSWAYNFHLPHWLEGWKEAEKEYNTEIAEQEEIN